MCRRWGSRIIGRSDGGAGAAVDNGTIAQHIAGGQIGGQRSAGIRGVGGGAAKGWRDQSRVFAHIHIGKLPPVRRDNRFHRSRLAILRVTGAAMSYSNALVGTVRAAVRHSRDKSMVSFFILHYLRRLIK